MGRAVQGQRPGAVRVVRDVGPVSTRDDGVMAVRMSDVARAAGVSPMTVSNVINGHPNVRAETRLRVLACIADRRAARRPDRGLRRHRRVRVPDTALTSVDPGNEATAETILGLLERRMVQNAGSDLTGDIERVKKIMPAKLVLRGSTRPLSGQGAGAHERLLFETAGYSDTSRLPSMRVAAGSGESRTDSQRDARAHLRRDRRPSGPNEDACNRDARRSEPRTGCRAGLADDAQTSPRLSRPGEECGLEVAGLAVRGSPGPLAGRRSP